MDGHDVKMNAFTVVDRAFPLANLPGWELIQEWNRPLWSLEIIVNAFFSQP